MLPVENEDVIEALVRFETGVVGHIGASRIAFGRKNGLDLELYGTKGGLRFTQERFKFVPPGQIKTVLDSRLVD